MANKLREENGIKSTVVIVEDGNENSLVEAEAAAFNNLLPLGEKNVRLRKRKPLVFVSVSAKQNNHKCKTNHFR